MARAAPQHRPHHKHWLAQHSKPRKHSASDEKRVSPRQRGYCAKWDEFSKAFRQNNPLCEFCLADGRAEPSTVTDHDIPHRQDLELFWDNTFTALCARHHNGEKRRAEARYTGADLLRWIAKRKAR